jgi:hypothetical protein
MEATRIGIDVAKSWFHLVAMDSRGKVIWRKALTRRRVLAALVPLRPALVIMEACATAHYWAREMQKLGHEVKLIHPAFVVPFRKSGKNDFNDAEALCEASCRPMMRFVEIKSIDQQDIQSCIASVGCSSSSAPSSLINYVDCWPNTVSRCAAASQRCGVKPLNWRPNLRGSPSPCG